MQRLLFPLPMGHKSNKVMARILHPFPPPHLYRSPPSSSLHYPQPDPKQRRLRSRMLRPEHYAKPHTHLNLRVKDAATIDKIPPGIELDRRNRRLNAIDDRKPPVLTDPVVVDGPRFDPAHQTACRDAEHVGVVAREEDGRCADGFVRGPRDGESADFGADVEIAPAGSRLVEG